MSIHGICFDEGQSGHCGIDCRGISLRECGITDEIAINALDWEIQNNIDAVGVLILGAVRYNVMKAQTKFNIDIGGEIRKACADMDYFELAEMLQDLL